MVESSEDDWAGLLAYHLAVMTADSKAAHWVEMLATCLVEMSVEPRAFDWVALKVGPKAVWKAEL